MAATEPSIPVIYKGALTEPRLLPWALSVQVNGGDTHHVSLRACRQEEKHEEPCMERLLGALFSVMNKSNYLIWRSENIMNVGGLCLIETKSKYS